MFSLCYFNVSESWRWFRAIPVKFAQMALNHLQEPGYIKIIQCTHEVSHFYLNYLYS